MPKAKKQNRARSAGNSTSATTKSRSSANATTHDQVFLNVAVSKRTRAGLNKLVSVMNATSQRDVLDQLIATELHRHNMRLTPLEAEE
jgi:hypothetical protein